MKHATRDRGGFIDNHGVPIGTQDPFKGNDIRENMVGVGSYQLKRQDVLDSS